MHASVRDSRGPIADGLCSQQILHVRRGIVEKCIRPDVEGSRIGRRRGVNKGVRRPQQSDRDDTEVAAASPKLVAMDKGFGEAASDRRDVQEFRGVRAAAGCSRDRARADEGMAGPGGERSDGPQGVCGARREETPRSVAARGHVPLHTAGTQRKRAIRGANGAFPVREDVLH